MTLCLGPLCLCFGNVLNDNFFRTIQIYRRPPLPKGGVQKRQNIWTKYLVLSGAVHHPWTKVRVCAPKEGVTLAINHVFLFTDQLRVYPQISLRSPSSSTWSWNLCQMPFLCRDQSARAGPLWATLAIFIVIFHSDNQLEANGGLWSLCNSFLFISSSGWFQDGLAESEQSSLSTYTTDQKGKTVCSAFVFSYAEKI